MGRPRGFEPDTVIDRAMTAFWTHGYAGTSPARLVEATGVAKGSLYHSFGGKRELFALALARYEQQSRELFADYLSRPESTRDCLRALLRYLVDSDVTEPIRRGCLVVNTTLEEAGRDPETAATLRAVVERGIAGVADRIEQGRRDGDVSADTDPRATAEFLMTTVSGLRVMARTQDAPMLYGVIDTALARL